MIRPCEAGTTSRHQLCRVTELSGREKAKKKSSFLWVDVLLTLAGAGCILRVCPVPFVPGGYSAFLGSLWKGWEEHVSSGP